MLDFRTQKNDIFKTLTMVLLLLVLTILSVLISQGVSLDEARLSNFDFWLTVGLDMAFVLFVFNIVRSMHSDNVKKNKDGPYFAAFVRFSSCVKYIKREKLYDKLNNAVSNYNEELKEQAYEKALFRITDKITYSDIGEYDITLNSYGLETRELKRFTKLQQKYNAGTLKYGKMRARYITHDKIIMPNFYTKSDLSSSTGKVKATVNGMVVGSFFITNVILKSLVFGSIDDSIWYVILEQSFMFLSAVSSAIFHTKAIINEMIANLTQKADWCQRFGLEEQNM